MARVDVSGGPSQGLHGLDTLARLRAALGVQPQAQVPPAARIVPGVEPQQRLGGGFLPEEGRPPLVQRLAQFEEVKPLSLADAAMRTRQQSLTARLFGGALQESTSPSISAVPAASV